MTAWLRRLWDRLHSTFWFLPSLMAAGAGGLALAAVALDEAVSDRWLQSLSWAYNGGAEGASQVLSTIAGSMITIAGVVFSMTLVALTLASSQLGPRLLRNFMRDTVNQAVIGTFVSTFVYCLLVLRTIRRADEVAFVPHLAVTLGVLLALVSLGVLIYFIHHVAVSIQADQVIARVARELFESIERLYPRRIGDALDGADCQAPATAWPDLDVLQSRPVAAAQDGYLQAIDSDALMGLAVGSDVRLRLERRPGDYVVKGRPLATVQPGSRVDEAFSKHLNEAFSLGEQRTATQDIEFAINQLVEIAVRALSPGINDPFTAITCVDRLNSALSRLARCDMPSAHRLDAGGNLRVIARAATFPGIVDAALDQIRQHARQDVAVTLRLLETIEGVAASTRTADGRAALRRQADMIARGARDAIAEPEDGRAVDERFRAALRAIEEAGVVRSGEDASPPARS